MRRQNLGAVRKPRADVAPAVRVEHGRADLGVPEDLEPLALGVVGDAGQAQGLKVAGLAQQGFDEPGAPAKLDEASWLDGVPSSLLHHFR